MVWYGMVWVRYGYGMGMVRSSMVQYGVVCVWLWYRYGMGMVWIWYGYGMGMAWVWYGHGIGMAWVWDGDADGDGDGMVLFACMLNAHLYIGVYT